MKLDKNGNASEATTRTPSTMPKKDGLVEAGLEMIDHIIGTQLIGSGYKDKRLIKTASKKLKPDTLCEGKSSVESPEVKKGPKMVIYAH